MATVIHNNLAFTGTGYIQMKILSKYFIMQIMCCREMSTIQSKTKLVCQDYLYFKLIPHE